MFNELTRMNELNGNSILSPAPNPRAGTIKCTQSAGRETKTVNSHVEDAKYQAFQSSAGY